MTPLENPIDALLPVIAKAVSEWQQVNTEQKLSASVKAMLDKESQQITLKLMGFDEGYGGWSLDHCNGRAGNSTAGDYLRNAQGEAIKQWLSTVSMPVLNEELKASLQKEAQRSYDQHLATKIRALAIQQAETDAEALVAAVTQSNHIESYIKMMRLINPTE